MNLDEMDARDWNEQEPENPVIETELGERLARETFKDGTTGWRLTDGALTEYEQDRFEEAYEMGFKAGNKQGFNRGFSEGRR